MKRICLGSLIAATIGFAQSQGQPGTKWTEDQLRQAVAAVACREKAHTEILAGRRAGRGLPQLRRR